ncbi:acetyl/propionyl/methylcrotonyl-CoA carboxylase subunit alpha [Aestuariibacter halophilus]|uniref:Acetyl/propionyl/methylcrotonyl-CoA carboxylase subunit alpha n=1 Tax=Fluctibacter halophilus TaxID=226011 RepID=A0ABS8G608_9ALTE|nr:acetyl/propionyl/methylcrotonyl-CoA carboxylase subunit alpha [Aestuariibacter halophilus]MCC2615843.1 acetyl/propionyl/methylcrotonyl-CoA carboxylase subunit alpha [Aestuariibacter halophilus]
MIRKLLIANRGEISCRVMKTAQRMGIRTVAVYSDADSDALHVKMADEAVHIGGAPSKDSYLRAEHIIEVAKRLGVDAIHPGYGFLSENARFCRLCEQNDIIFVGPPVGAIEAMGSKSAAKQIMEKAGVPLVPGYHGDDQSVETLRSSAQSMGYPVLLKAAAGGGGKGMRQVWSDDEFDAALDAAKREAQSSFGDDIMLVEKYLTQPRHVEIQVFCDQHGNGVYLFERDCSVQRRHQKVIEEAPAPGMTEQLRSAMGEAALKAAQAINYVGAGTVEFLLDSDGQFYFMEMNTRLQVEHPVTEMITGVDLVEWQLRVASKEPLPLQQSELKLHGHAFEARVYAEDPDNDFLPATGHLRLLRPPLENRHVRVDTGVLEGDDVSVYYDPMIAKLVVWDEDRTKALARLAKALTEYHIDGVTTNVNFLYNLATTPAFMDAQLSTNFITEHEAAIFHRDASEHNGLLPVAALYLLLDQQNKVPQQQDDRFSPWQQHNAWRANEQHVQSLTLRLNDDDFDLRVKRLDNGYSIDYQNQTFVCHGELSGNSLIANVDGHRSEFVVVEHESGHSLFAPGEALRFTRVMPDLGLDDDTGHDAGFTAPMNGTVVALAVEPGQMVDKDQTLMIMEAMKMEHALKAPSRGKVTEFFYQPGDLVDGGAELLAFEADQGASS